jgi:hypothetical protein
MLFSTCMKIPLLTDCGIWYCIWLMSNDGSFKFFLPRGQLEKDSGILLNWIGCIIVIIVVDPHCNKAFRSIIISSERILNFELAFFLDFANGGRRGRIFHYSYTRLPIILMYDNETTFFLQPHIQYTCVSYTFIYEIAKFETSGRLPFWFVVQWQ